MYQIKIIILFFFALLIIYTMSGFNGAYSIENPIFPPYENHAGASQSQLIAAIKNSVVKIYLNPRSICTASRLKPTWYLTAAHCLTEKIEGRIQLLRSIKPFPHSKSAINKILISPYFSRYQSLMDNLLQSIQSLSQDLDRQKNSPADDLEKIKNKISILERQYVKAMHLRDLHDMAIFKVSEEPKDASKGNLLPYINLKALLGSSGIAADQASYYSLLNSKLIFAGFGSGKVELNTENKFYYNSSTDRAKFNIGQSSLSEHWMVHDAPYKKELSLFSKDYLNTKSNDVQEKKYLTLLSDFLEKGTFYYSMKPTEVSHSLCNQLLFPPPDDHNPASMFNSILTERQTFSYYPNYSLAQPGDSGGPVFIEINQKWYLFGVISGISISSSYPEVAFNIYQDGDVLRKVNLTQMPNNWLNTDTKLFDLLDVRAEISSMVTMGNLVLPKKDNKENMIDIERILTRKSYTSFSELHFFSNTDLFNQFNQLMSSK